MSMDLPASEKRKIVFVYSDRSTDEISVDIEQYDGDPFICVKNRDQWLNLHSKAHAEKVCEAIQDLMEHLK